MKLIVQIDLDAGAVPNAPAKEVGRALRYWAGGLTTDLLRADLNQTIYDSNYEPIGSLTITDA